MILLFLKDLSFFVIWGKIDLHYEVIFRDKEMDLFTRLFNSNIRAQEYVSRPDGSIHSVSKDVGLLCHLYERRLNMIKTINVNTVNISNIRNINEDYCHVSYRSIWIYRDKCRICSSTSKPRDENIKAILDMNKQVIFMIDDKKVGKSN